MLPLKRRGLHWPRPPMSPERGVLQDQIRIDGEAHLRRHLIDCCFIHRPGPFLGPTWTAEDIACCSRRASGSVRPLRLFLLLVLFSIIFLYVGKRYCEGYGITPRPSCLHCRLSCDKYKELWSVQIRSGSKPLLGCHLPLIDLKYINFE